MCCVHCVCTQELRCGSCPGRGGARGQVHQTRGEPVGSWQSVIHGLGRGFGACWDTRSGTKALH